MKCILAMLAIVAALAAPASALDCQREEGVKVLLEFKQSNLHPGYQVPSMGFVKKGELCVSDQKDGGYVVKGVPGKYTDDRQAKAFVDLAIAFRPFIGAFKDPDEMMRAIIAVNAIQALYDAAIAGKEAKKN